MTSSFSRRWFLASALGAVAPVVTLARQGTPASTEPEDGRLIRDIVSLEGVQQVVTMHATIPPTETQPDNVIYFLDGWGFQFESAEQAAACPQTFVEAYVEWFSVDSGLVVDGFEEIPPAELPEHAIGWTATIDGTKHPELPAEHWALIAVVRDTDVQMLIGIANSGSPLATMNQAVEVTSPRWPDDSEPVRELDGTHHGGIWEMLPRQEDLEDPLKIMFARNVTGQF